MGQILLPDNIPSVVKASSTSLTLAATNLGQPTAMTIGGQQYVPSGTITLSTAGTGANGLDTGALGSSFQLYYVYAIVHNTTFVPAMIASLAVPSTGPAMPSGYGTAYKLIGAFYVSDTAAIASTVTITGMAKSDPFTFTPSGLFTTNTSYDSSSRWWREGHKMWIHARMTFAGLPNAADGTFNVPSGFSISSDTGPTPWFGSGKLRITSTSANYALGVEFRNSGAVNLTHLLNNGGNGGQIRESQPVNLASGDSIEVLYAIPISGWSSTLT